MDIVRTAYDVRWGKAGVNRVRELSVPRRAVWCVRVNVSSDVSTIGCTHAIDAVTTAITTIADRSHIEELCYFIDR